MDLVAGLQWNAARGRARHFYAAAFPKHRRAASTLIVAKAELAGRCIVSYVGVLAGNRDLRFGEGHIIAPPQPVALAENFLHSSDVDAIRGDFDLACLGLAAQYNQPGSRPCRRFGGLHRFAEILDGECGLFRDRDVKFQRQTNNGAAGLGEQLAHIRLQRFKRDTQPLCLVLLTNRNPGHQ